MENFQKKISFNDKVPNLASSILKNNEQLEKPVENCNNDKSVESIKYHMANPEILKAAKI